MKGDARKRRRCMEAEKGETEALETKVVSEGVEGVHVDYDGECHQERWQVKKIQKAK